LFYTVVALEVTGDWVLGNTSSIEKISIALEGLSSRNLSFGGEGTGK
jgi:hypothetical protein